jgi:hypothetical protein
LNRTTLGIAVLLLWVAGLGLLATLNYTGRYWFAKGGSAKGLARTTEALTSATVISADALLLPAMIMPTLRTRASKAFRLSISGNTVRPTRGSLVKDGFIVDSGLVRLTKAGNPAIVWRVA